jgi:hypothetical protein
MNRSYLVQNVQSDLRDPGAVSAIQSDALIFAVGYEKRARVIAQLSIWKPSNVLGVVYRSGHIFSFEENRRIADQNGFRTVSDDLAEIGDAVSRLVLDLRGNQPSIRIAVDVSAMDRSVMAECILSIVGLLRPTDSILLLYTPAVFQKPSLNLHPIKAYGPVHPKLSGNVGDPSWSTALILGVGYDYGVSLSILDSHEADINFIFSPFGFDSAYDEEVKTANFDFDFGERVYWHRGYNIADICSLYTTLNNIIYPMIHNHNIVIAPMGPKIFSASCILVASIYPNQVSVLRYSLEKERQQRDVEPSPFVLGCSAMLLAGVSKNPEGP